MRTRSRPARRAERRRSAEPRSGTGALCPEAQADGVPCPELGRECEDCERAVAARRGAEPEPDGSFLDRAFRAR